MKRVLFLAAALLVGNAAHAGGPKTAVEQSADVLLVGLPVAAFGLTFLLPSEPAAGGANSLLGVDVLRMTGSPRHDFGLAMTRTLAVTYGLKYTVDEQRPNGEDGSFPSAHTAITFAGAEFIRKEYGWTFGAPAYAAATYVGWSRVETQDHWWHDVAIGAAIGMLSNHDLSEVTTRWGKISAKPAMFDTGSDASRYQSVPDAAPGLKLEMHF